MDTYHWLLTFHVSAAFLFIGGATAAAILNTLAIRAARPSEAATLLRLIRRALPALFVGIGGTLAFGIALWKERGYSIGSGWIWASLVLWALAGFLGQRGGEHQQKCREHAERLAASGDAPDDELIALLRDPKGTGMSYLAGVAAVAILVLMVWKP